MNSVGVAAKLHISRRNHRPAPQIIRLGSQRRLDPLDGCDKINLGCRVLRTIGTRLAGQVRAAQDGIKPQREARHRQQTHQERTATHILQGPDPTSGVGFEPHDLACQFAPRGVRLGTPQLAGRKIGIDAGEQLTKMAVGIVRRGCTCVDHAGPGCIVERSASNGGYGNGDKPEKHGPWMLSAVERQECGMYKRNGHQHHQNTRDQDGPFATGSARRMSAIHIDFAVIGATPQARLIAGLLHSVHGKSVLYQGESQSAYRLPRGFDLSIAPLTRPETWALLKESVPQSRKLIARVGGRHSMRRIDAVLCATTEAGMDVLGHVLHMAQAFKLPAERLRGDGLGTAREGLLVRDALFLHRASLEPVLDRWLVSLGVHRLPPEADLVLKPDGSGVALAGDDGFEIGRTVLADDAAILAHVPSERWPPSLEVRSASTLLGTPIRSLPVAFIRQLEGELTLAQRARSGVAALGLGSTENLAGEVLGLLNLADGLQQAGQSTYSRLLTADRAPTIGRAAGMGPDIIAGIDMIGAFLAPALARWLAGAAYAGEADWFAARSPDRDFGSSMVAEWDGTP